MTRLSRITLALAAVLSVVVATGCNSNNKATTNLDTKGQTTPSGGPSCARNEPGCPCSSEGKRIACGKVVSTAPNGAVTCGTGGQVCSAGKWSDCQVDSYAPGHDGIAIQTLGSPAKCTDACDLYCKTVADLPDDSINLDGGASNVSGPGGGSSGSKLVLSDAGLTLNQTNRLPDGGMLPADRVVLDTYMDGGIDAAGPNLIFHELLPGETATDPVQLLPGEIPSTDIYFLLDDTSSMADESANLTAALNDSNSLLKQIRALFNDDSNKVQFGFGRFEEYGARPTQGSNYVTALDTTVNRPFEHIVSITPTDTAVAAAAGWVKTDAFIDPVSGGAGVNHTGGTVPESTVTALMMLATGGTDYETGSVIGAWRAGALDCTPTGAPASIYNKYWAPPRKCWSGTPVTLGLFPTAPAADIGTGTPGAPVGSPGTIPCPAVANAPAGYTPGYPCWRPNKTPIVVVMTDASAHNGPGGQYHYVATPGSTSLPQAYMLTGELSWGTVAASPGASADPASVAVSVATLTAPGADGSSFGAPVNLGTIGAGKIIYGAVPARASASSVGGGITQSLTERELVGSAAWPSLTANRTYRNTLRDCSTATSVKSCLPGGTQYNSSNATSSYSKAAGSVTDTQYPVLTTVAKVADTFSLVSQSARGAQPGPVDVGPQVTPAVTCDVITVNTTNAAATYTGGATGPTQFSVLSSSAVATIIGPIPMTQGQRINVKIDFVTVNAGDIRVRARVGTGNPPANTYATGYIDSRSTSLVTTSNKTIYDPTTGSTNYYIALEPDATVVGNGKVNITYTVSTPSCSAGKYLDVTTTTNTTAAKCYTCNGGYTLTNSCPVGSVTTGGASTNVGKVGCYNSPQPSCSSYGGGAFSGTGPLGGVCGAGRCCTQAAQPGCPAVGGMILENTSSTTCTYCPTGSPNWNGSTGAAGRCYLACPAGMPNYNNTNCYANCPASSDVRSTDKYEVCIDKCAAGYAHGSNVTTNPPTCTKTSTSCSGTTLDGTAWTLSGGTCTGSANSCTCTGNGAPATCTAAACGAGYTCSGALGSAKCVPTAALCGACTGTCDTLVSPWTAGQANASPAVPPSTVASAGSIYCVDSCKTQPATAKGDGARYGEMIFKFTVPGPAGSQNIKDRFYYHFALLRQTNGTAITSDTASFLSIKAASNVIYNEAAGAGNPDGKVLDCNRDANVFYLKGDTTDTGHAVRSEINGFLYPGDYFLIVDKYGDSATLPPAAAPSYNFILQMGAFQESQAIAASGTLPISKRFIGNPYTAPTFDQTVQALIDANIKVVGVDSSGVTCQQANLASVNISQYETRDWLEALGRSTNSVRGKDDDPPGTGKAGDPFVNSVKTDATSCSAGGVDFRAAIVQNISDLTKTLREDITVRAVNTNQQVYSPVYIPSNIPGTSGLTPESFIQSVDALTNAEAAALGYTITADDNCGSTSPVIASIATDTGVGYSSELYRLCLPGTSVLFKVTFVMPTTIPRGAVDEFFRFDLILKKGAGELARTPVVLKLPKVPDIGDFYRDYDLSDVCPAGTHIVYDRVAWDSDDPLASATGAIGSKIDITAVMSTSMANLATLTGTASEKALKFGGAGGTCTNTDAVAKASPTPNTEVSSARVDCAFGTQTDPYLRVHFRLSPSPQGAYPNNQIYVPTLKGWNLYVSCPPTE